MGDGIRIREAEPGDFDRWLPLWDGYNLFYGRAGPTAVPRQVTEASWRRFHDVGQPIHALVAEADGALVGLAHYLFHLSTTTIAPACYLRDLYTTPAARGRGVATALIDAVCAAARTAGSPSIYWQTHETNRAAQGLYDKVASRSGFIVYRKDA